MTESTSLEPVHQLHFSDLYAAFAALETSGPVKDTKATPSPQTQSKGKDDKDKGKGKDKGKDKDNKKKEDKPKKDRKPNKAAADKPIDVSILDIRVGKIVKVEPHPDADGLYVEQIDLGEETPRQVVSGLRKFVPIEKMENRSVVVILNLKPAKMRNVMSYGMVLCASNEEHTEVDPVAVPEGSSPGDKVSFEGFEGEPEAQINPKKKLLEKLFPDLKTDADGVAKYKDAVFMTPKGACTASLKSAWVK